MRIRAATARTDSKIPKGADGERDQHGQRFAPASQVPGSRGDDPVATAAKSRWKEPEVDRGLPGEPDYALAIRRTFGNWRNAIDATGVREAR